jgi:hypothetical protein
MLEYFTRRWVCDFYKVSRAPVLKAEETGEREREREREREGEREREREGEREREREGERERQRCRVTCDLRSSAFENALLSSATSPSSTSPFFSLRSITDPDDGLYRPATIPSRVLLPHPDLRYGGVSSVEGLA